ncbi:dUTP diphosphatase [Nocardioides pantholopis]|uniref:dUTP diphosphatase n=1 Tax=Nocardioides pantholopis TaxID=2483798 RepID=UPI0021E14C46|nr:dUTP diphosphatase [Nocardioides pantholopis]
MPSLPDADATAGTDLDIQVLRLDADLPLPAYAHPGDAGADLLTTVDLTLRPGERALVPTGIALALPTGYVALVHPRSGLAARHGLSIVNSPGTVDAGYRGEIKVLLINHDPAEPIELRRGDRVAQLVVQRFERARFVPVERLPDSVRGEGGYGSTGGFGRS